MKKLVSALLGALLGLAAGWGFIWLLVEVVNR